MKTQPVRAKKHLGQHFLNDLNIAEKIAKTLSLEGYEHILEIGPGTGVLTQFLLQYPQSLKALDVDAESIAYLKTHFILEHRELLQDTSRFEVVEADFLKVDLTKLFGKKQFAVCGNFPYNISSQIVFRTIENRQWIPEFSGMFQKEVAQRICAQPGSKTYGILSVLTQAYYQTTYLFTVPPNVFSPPPKVDSGVLQLQRKEDYHLDCDEKLFFRIVKAAFNLRRKTLRNSLKSFQLSDNLKKDAIFGQRPEQLSVAQFVSLTKSIENDDI
ncbi:MAG: 16S rRNA (adenine(1518)-N(6)/adenine(1519)-N(6))-dimethyltransferase RsmA [Flavobacteriaceae bacterium]|nr:16S rRNA (adenine(1518)-N(6)/adenine(1519)-N(6))-dimethyltransferase RsmA [Flavobacteriaceae bacterium]